MPRSRDKKIERRPITTTWRVVSQPQWVSQGFAIEKSGQRNFDAGRDGQKIKIILGIHLVDAIDPRHLLTRVRKKVL